MNQISHSKNTSSTMFRSLRGWRISIPIIIGVLVVVYMFWGEFDYAEFKNINFTKHALIWFICALCMMFLRDIGYIIRLKIISESKLTWLQCLRVILLWEFTSTVTPSAVGGTPFAIIYISKENISVGKSSAMVMLTAFLDEFYFLIMFPLVLILADFDSVFTFSSLYSDGINWSTKFMYFALIGYSLKAGFVLLVFYGLFINPCAVKKMLFRIFSFRFLRKWRRRIVKVGSDIMNASISYKGKSWKFWLSTLFATFLSWTSRYWVVNFLFLLFFVVPEHFIIFARQLVMWIMMIVLPSPGGSGFSEFLFSEFLGEFIPYMYLVPILAVLWRIVTYYTYLIVGAFMLPAWIKKKF